MDGGELGGVKVVSEGVVSEGVKVVSGEVKVVSWGSEGGEWE